MTNTIIANTVYRRPNISKALYTYYWLTIILTQKKNKTLLTPLGKTEGNESSNSLPEVIQLMSVQPASKPTSSWFHTLPCLSPTYDLGGQRRRDLDLYYARYPAKEFAHLFYLLHPGRQLLWLPHRWENLFGKLSVIHGQ